ncbi:MAG TPA: ABC transporter permease [Elainellaceae cyanobacterium]
MKRIWSQCLKELAQFRRDRLTVALAILLPLITLLLFGSAIRLQVENLPIVIQDFDRGPLSRGLIEQIFATNQFKPVAGFSDNPIRALEQGSAKGVVVIPPDFDRQIRDAQTTVVQVVIDGTDTNNARVVQNSIRATVNAFLSTAGLQASQPLVESETRLWFNPGRKESLYIVPGVYGVILWIYPSLLAAVAMVREKERGTILQVYASSLSATELLLGKGLAYFFVGIAEALTVISLGSLFSGVGLAGDPTPLGIGTAIYLATSVMFGLFLGTRANNQNAAVQGAATVGFMTSLLLSGFIYPTSNIPFPLSLISRIIPARYYIQITRDAFVRGAGWAAVWLQCLIIAAICLLLFIVTRRMLSRMQLSD